MAINNSFTWFEGEDIELDFSPTTVTDITGWTLDAIMYSFSGGDPLIEKTIGNGITVTNAALGLFNILYMSADTLTYGGRTLYLEVRRTDTGDNTVLAYGNVMIMN